MPSGMVIGSRAMWLGGWPAGVLGLVLAACGGGGGGDGGGSYDDFPPTDAVYCDSVRGVVTTTSDPACSACSVEDAAAAADAVLASYAGLFVNQAASGSGPAIRATNGAELPMGPATGAWVRIAQGAQAWSMTFNTYRSGVLQQSYSVPTTQPTGQAAINTYFSFTTRLPYDALEVRISNANFSPAPIEFRVYELCSDGGIR